MVELYTIGVKTDVLKEAGQACAILSHPLAITARLKASGYKCFFILSTCNRFEIYSSANNLHDLCAVVFEEHTDLHSAFKAVSYELTGEGALLHLFRVAAGLESNLLGDYEIAGQVKTAAKNAREEGCLNGNLERIINTALSASKEVKARTSICRGKISYASAAVEMALQKDGSLKAVPVLIYGLGKIGRSLLDYIVRHTDADDITLCNRHSKHIQDCLENYDVKFLHRDNMTQSLHSYPVVFVCTGADTYTLTVLDFPANLNHCVFDLASPANVHPDVALLTGVKLYGMKELEEVFAETIMQRKTEIPVAEAILYKHLQQFKTDLYRRNQYLFDLQSEQKVTQVQQPEEIAI